MEAKEGLRKNSFEQRPVALAEEHRREETRSWEAVVQETPLEEEPGCYCSWEELACSQLAVHCLLSKGVQL